MGNELSDKIERINKTLQDQQVEKSSYERQAEDVEKELTELTKECEQKFGLKPEEFTKEIEKLESSMETIILELEEKLSE